MANSNLAYELFEEQEERLSPRKAPIQKPAAKKNFMPIIYALVLSLAAFYMISKNVALYETNQQIKQLQKQLSNIEAYTSQRIFELEHSTDLAAVEEIARTRLNMQRPEQYQIEYVSIDRDDVTEVTANEVEGIRSKFNGAKKNLKRNIVGIFTLS